MMYSNKMVVALKQNGKVLREQDDNVFLPFGSEYSIMLKNLESRKAKVKISIDSVNVLNGSSLLINPNDSIELEGFLSDTIAKNKFRFIEKTKEISEFRGDNIDDGFIRIEFWYEKMKPVVQEVIKKYNDYNPYSYPYTWITTSGFSTLDVTSTVYCNNMQSKSLRSLDVSQNYCSVDSLPVHDSGITVKGEQINQQFKYASIGILEDQSHVIILKLKGYKDNQEKVEQPLLVKDKLQCKTCGKVNKSDCKFCGSCGTFLE